MDDRTADALRAMTSRDALVTPREAERVGVSGDDLRAACRSGMLARVRLGAYTASQRWEGADGAEQHRLRVLAAARRLTAPVFSHDSAAALWRLPRIGPWPAEVHVSLPHAAGNRSSQGVRRHAVPGAVTHHVMIDGVRVTGVARTVVDLARTWDFASAVVAADHALHARWTSPDRLVRELDAAGCGRGVGRARRVLEVADAASESVGESLSRARMAELGLPLPELQHVVEDARGMVGRVDFWWADLGLVGEFDGRAKYRVASADTPEAVEERLWAEKVREDRLRALGLRVVRWTWDTALQPDRLASVLASVGLRA